MFSAISCVAFAVMVSLIILFVSSTIHLQEYDDALNQSRTLWSYSKNKSEINYEAAQQETASAVAAVGTATTNKQIAARKCRQ